MVLKHIYFNNHSLRYFYENNLLPEIQVLPLFYGRFIKYDTQHLKNECNIEGNFIERSILRKLKLFVSSRLIRNI